MSHHLVFMPKQVTHPYRQAVCISHCHASMVESLNFLLKKASSQFGKSDGILVGGEKKAE